MNWIKRIFSKKEPQKQEVKRTVIKPVEHNYKPPTSRTSSYEQKTYQDNRNSDNDLLDPLNVLNPLSPHSIFDYYDYSNHSNDSTSSSCSCD